jgi:hypothetical protein
MFKFLLPYLILIPVAAFCQDNYRAGSLTQLNINTKVTKALKLNTKLESRQIFSEKEIDTPARNRFRYERTDLTLLLTTKLSADNTIGGGYLIRLEDKIYSHRLIQQFNNVRSLDWLSMAHRIVTDETFSSDAPAEFRVRYRLGLEKPLNGLHLDPDEFYAKVNNEYLGMWSDGKADMEIRALLTIGYNTSSENKVELGMEYRVNEFAKETKAQQFWINLGWFFSI